MKFKILLVVLLLGISPAVYAKPEPKPVVKAAAPVISACEANFAKMRVYYLMPRLFRDGTLDEVATALPDLKKMGVNTYVGWPSTSANNL